MNFQHHRFVLSLPPDRAHTLIPQQKTCKFKISPGFPIWLHRWYSRMPYKLMIPLCSLSFNGSGCQFGHARRENGGICEEIPPFTASSTDLGPRFLHRRSGFSSQKRSSCPRHGHLRWDTIYRDWPTTFAQILVLSAGTRLSLSIGGPIATSCSGTAAPAACPTNAWNKGRFMCRPLSACFLQDGGKAKAGYDTVVAARLGVKVPF